LSTRPDSAGSTVADGSSLSAQTDSAAARVAPPGKTASLRASTCSDADSRSQLQSTTARSVRCWGSAVRLPPVSNPNLSSRRSASWAGVSVRSQTAAGSIASGIPSRARQIRATAAALASPSSKSCRTATARSRSSRTDP
jgi:hypothetical protein